MSRPPARPSMDAERTAQRASLPGTHPYRINTPLGVPYHIEVEVGLLGPGEPGPAGARVGEGYYLIVRPADAPPEGPSA